MAEDRIPVPTRSESEKQSEIKRLQQQQEQIDEAPREDKTPKEAESLADRKAKIAQLLHRGVVADRLEVRNPDPNKEYEWVRETDQDIERHLALGFVIELEDGTELNRVHDTGDRVRRIGDVILMSTSKENYELIRQVRREQKARKSTLGKEEYLRRSLTANKGQPASAQVPVLDPLGISKSIGQE